MTPTREQVIEQSRIDFETYFWESRKSKGAKRAPTFLRYEDDDTYIDDHTQRHWWTWQQAVIAGRAQGLREAREVCEAKSACVIESNTTRGRVNGAASFAAGLLDDCAAAIKQLEGK